MAKPTFREMVTSRSVIATAEIEQGQFRKIISKINRRFDLRLEASQEAYELSQDRTRFVAGRFWDEREAVNRKTVLERLTALTADVRWRRSICAAPPAIETRWSRPVGPRRRLAKRMIEYAQAGKSAADVSMQLGCSMPREPVRSSLGGTLHSARVLTVRGPVLKYPIAWSPLQAPLSLDEPAKTGPEISMSRTYSRLCCSVAAALALAIADHRNAAAQTHYAGNSVQLACYFPMPFFRAARVEIIPPPGLTTAVPLTFEMRTEPLSEDPRAVGYFHASYRDLGRGEPGKDHVLLDTRGMEGIENWSGSFIGTSITFTDRGELRTLEGDPRFFFDDAKSPQG